MSIKNINDGQQVPVDLNKSIYIEDLELFDKCSIENPIRHFSSNHGQNKNAKNSERTNAKAKSCFSFENCFSNMLEPSDNKLAMKLFGSKKGVLKEKLRQKNAGHWVIHPCSNFM